MRAKELLRDESRWTPVKFEECRHWWFEIIESHFTILANLAHAFYCTHTSKVYG